MYPEPFQSPKDNNTQTQANSGTFQHPQAYNTQTQMNTGQFQQSSFGDLYPYAQIPPPPPGIHKTGIRVIILISVVCVVLASVIGAYAINSNKETQKSNINFTTSIST